MDILSWALILLGVAVVATILADILLAIGFAIGSNRQYHRDERMMLIEPDVPHMEVEILDLEAGESAQAKARVGHCDAS